MIIFVQYNTMNSNTTFSLDGHWILNDLIVRKNSMKRLFYLSILLLLFSSCQKQYDLDWKLDDDEIITYKVDFDLKNIENPELGWDSKEKIELTPNSESFIKEFISNDKFCELTRRDDDVARVRMYHKSSDSMLNNMPLVMGTVYLNGGIESFFIDRNQISMLSAIFELPVKEVAVGEKWNVEFASIYTNGPFACDKADRIREATLESVEGDIATISYRLYENSNGNFIIGSDKKPSTLKSDFDAIGKFSISKGRWINYQLKGIIEMTGTWETHIKYDIKLGLIE